MRTVSTTVADGNCLYRSILKGLIGTILPLQSTFSNPRIYLYESSNIEPHTLSTTNLRLLCGNEQGVWGTEIEILGIATLLQPPVYTSSGGKVAI